MELRRAKDQEAQNVRSPVTCPARAFRTSASVTRWRALAFDLVGERGQRQEDLVRREVESALTILQLEPHLHAVISAERVRGFDRLAADA